MSKAEKINFYVVLNHESSNKYPPISWRDLDIEGRLSEEKLRLIKNNPLGLLDDDPIQIVALVDDILIGRIDIIKGRINIGNDVEPILWLSHWVTSPLFRHTGVGIFLMLRLQSMGISLGGCNVSQIAYPLYKKLGWIELALPRFILIQNCRSPMNRYLGTKFWVNILIKILNSFFIAQTTIIGLAVKIKYRKFQVRVTKEIPDDLNTLLLQRNQNEISFYRSKEWLRWLLDEKIVNNEKISKEIFLIYDNKNMIIGYFLIKKKLYQTASQKGFKSIELASLQDWNVFNRSVLSDFGLVMISVKEMVKLHPDAIEICSHEKKINWLLRLIGSIPMGKISIFLKPNTKAKNKLNATHKLSSWNIRPAEGDNFFS